MKPQSTSRALPSGAAGLGGAPGVPFRVDYRRAGEVEAVEPAHLLAIVRFGASVAEPAPWEIGVALRPQGEDGADLAEVWLSRQPVERGTIGDFGYAHNGEVLFGALRIDERRAGGLEAATIDAYRQIGAALAATGYRSLCRVWNFFPAIHGEEAGLERYRAFCRGRHRVLSEGMEAFEAALPAASAIGSCGPGLLVYGLALCEPASQVENPRQVSAFRYPADYGPRSPSFSRSVLKSWPTAGTVATDHLYVSGTAAIVGHASRHPGDYLRQLGETLDNLEALLVEAQRRTGRPLRFSLLRVYSRHAPPAELVWARIAAKFGAATPVLLLQGDICRRELLVEIEGMAVSEA